VERESVLKCLVLNEYFANLYLAFTWLKMKVEKPFLLSIIKA